jgi:hypothetical protein
MATIVGLNVLMTVELLEPTAAFWGLVYYLQFQWLQWSKGLDTTPDINQKFCPGLLLNDISRIN